jgi:hypothetical protein
MRDKDSVILESLYSVILENNDDIKIGVNVRSKTQDFADQIINGEKTIETRNSNSLKSYIGKKIGIVKTGRGRALLIGYATIGEPKIYNNEEEFDADYDKHLVSPDDKDFYIKKGKIKYGYPITNVELLDDPKEIHSRGIISRKINL